MNKIIAFDASGDKTVLVDCLPCEIIAVLTSTEVENLQQYASVIKIYFNAVLAMPIC